MTPAKTDRKAELTQNVLKALDDLNGPHPGYRPAHAKGVLIAGTFTPSPAGRALTRAPHLQGTSTSVTVRFSNATGIPNIPDAESNAGPRGMAIRFHLAEHVHTDIIAHSVDGFPARTPDEFLEMLRAIHASGTAAGSPSPIEMFLGTHPAALAYVQAPKPVPASFLKESFYSVNAQRFLNAAGRAQYGRYRIRPDGANAYLDPAAVAMRPNDFLFDEIKERLTGGPVKMRIAVQLASIGDVVDDATVQWPNERDEADFGVIELRNVLPDNDDEQQHIIFDPIARVDGIEPSDDPLLQPRADIYLASGRRRRAEKRS